MVEKTKKEKENLKLRQIIERLKAEVEKLKQTYEQKINNSRFKLKIRFAV